MAVNESYTWKLGTICLLASTCFAASSRVELTLAQLKKRPVTQPGIYRAKIDPTKPYQAIALGRKSVDQTVKSAGLLRHLTMTAATADRPFYFLKYANVLTDLDYDSAAYQATLQLMALNPRTRFSRNIQASPKSVKEFQARGAILNARVLARNGHRKEALAALATFKPRTGYDYAVMAEVLMLAGNDDDAAKAIQKAFDRSNGHPEKNFSRTFVPMWAVVLAHRIERPDLALRYGKGIMSKGVNSQKWPQWKAAYTIVSKNVALSSQGPVPSFKNLKPGTYTAHCRGYVGDVEVTVTVDPKGAPKVSVAKHREDRPYSSLTVIPNRINRRASLKVDAVTGATITSQAVVTATEEALREANR